MQLSGTSTLHDWTMSTPAFTGEAQFDFNTETVAHLVSLPSLTFSLKVINLKSDKRRLNLNAYKALKSDLYNDINYTLLTSNVIFQNENKYLIHTQGNLTITMLNPRLLCLVL